MVLVAVILVTILLSSLFYIYGQIPSSSIWLELLKSIISAVLSGLVTITAVFLGAREAFKNARKIRQNELSIEQEDRIEDIVI